MCFMGSPFVSSTPIGDHRSLLGLELDLVIELVFRHFGTGRLFAERLVGADGPMPGLHVQCIKQGWPWKRSPFHGFRHFGIRRDESELQRCHQFEAELLQRRIVAGVMTDLVDRGAF